jgi:hypothetical protein
MQQDASARSRPFPTWRKTKSKINSFSFVHLVRRPTMPALLLGRCLCHVRGFATHASVPQTYIEKVVEKFAVDLQPGKRVRAGDFVTIKPAHVCV